MNYTMVNLSGYKLQADGSFENILQNVFTQTVKDSRGKTIAWKKFDRFYTIDPDVENPSGKHYIFMTRPDLYLVDEQSVSDGDIHLSSMRYVPGKGYVGSGANEDPYFNYLAAVHPEIIASLTSDFAGLITGQSASEAGLAAASGSGYGNSRIMSSTNLQMPNGQSIPLTIHTFIPIITSRVESLQLPDYSLKTTSIVQPYTKYTIPYTQSGIESTTGGEFTLTLREDRFYSMHKLFYAWLYYMNNVARNIMQPKDKYTTYGALDYAVSVYDILVDDTGENIIYFSKYTGCVPTSVSMSGLGFNRGGQGERDCSVQFQYFLHEHMDLQILQDFQYNTLGHIAMKKVLSARDYLFRPVAYENTLPMYDNDFYTMASSYASRPIITRRDGDPNYKLRWLA